MTGLVNPWNDEEKDILKKMWTKGRSAKEIGAAVGRSKNGVVGMANRLGLPKHPWTLQKKKIEQKEPRKPVMQIKAKVPKPPQIVSPITFTSSGVSFMEVKADQCHAIVGKDNDRYSLVRFCGAPVKKEESYCPYHCDKFFAPRIRR